MYGPDDNNGQPAGGSTPPPIIDAPTSTGATDMPGAPVVTPPMDDSATASPAPTDTAAGNYIMDDTPPASTADNASDPLPAATTDVSAPANDDTTSVTDSTPDSAAADSNPAPDADPPSVSGTGGSADGLLNLKQQALQQLTPLVDHLEQSPEDEFRTTMMMIQASDNKDLLQKAYDAAQKMSDDKAKAQALLDIINEINYFTQHHTQA